MQVISRLNWIGLILALVAAIPAQAGTSITKQLERYAAAGAAQPNPDNGARLWQSQHGERSCSSCHGDDLTRSGRHVKTGKIIEPMAPSANPERFTDARKIEKWFLRNCKWTFGRSCSAQEKADLLSWLGDR